MEWLIDFVLKSFEHTFSTHVDTGSGDGDIFVCKIKSSLYYWMVPNETFPDNLHVSVRTAFVLGSRNTCLFEEIHAVTIAMNYK